MYCRTQGHNSLHKLVHVACVDSFKSERDLERHERSKHMTSDSAELRCHEQNCQFKCKHEFLLNKHIRNVHEVATRSDAVAACCG